MSEPHPVLEYATPAERRPFRLLVTPRLLAYCAAAVVCLTWLTRYNVGSGLVIVNPLRILGCGLAVLLVLAGALMRLWQDRHRGQLRAVVYAVCLIGSVVAFAHFHFSIWAEVHPRRRSLWHEYWESVFVASAFIAAAFLVGVLSALHLRWHSRSASRPAS